MSPHIKKYSSIILIILVIFLFFPSSDLGKIQAQTQIDNFIWKNDQYYIQYPNSGELPSMQNELYRNNLSLYSGSENNLDDDPNEGGSGIGTIPINDNYLSLLFFSLIYVLLKSRKEYNAFASK